MALANPDDGSLHEFLHQSRAATLNHCSQDDLVDNIYNKLTDNVRKCECHDLNYKYSFAHFENGLMLLHVNVRSLHKNFNLLYEFIESLNLLSYVICLSETKRKEPLTNIELTNYSFVHANSNTNVSGVGIYILNNFKYKINSKQYQLTNAKSYLLPSTT